MDALIDSYFHYPDGKSAEYKDLRQDTTNKYGYLTTAVLLGFMILISVFNTLIRQGYYYHNRFQLLKFTNQILNTFIDENPRNRWGNYRNRIINYIKTLYLRVYYHMSTIIQLTFWSIVLIALSLSELYHGDLIFLAKRLGRIAANSLPTILFLSLRPSPLPNTLYLALIPIHKWISRIIILQSFIHACLYSGFFNRNNTWEKAFKSENIYGWIAFSGFFIILITSLLQMRNRFYKLFYFLHYSCTWLIVICLQFHVRPVKLTKYTIANVLILLGQIIYRIKLTRTSGLFDIKVYDISPNLELVELPKHLISKPALNPGAHIRLTNYHPSPLMRMAKQIIPNYHPYTLVSLPNDFTQKLIRRKGNFKFINNSKYLITGSYDPNLLFIQNDQNKFQISKLKINTKRILIVIGGSAISFAIPIVRVMNYHGIPIKVVWVIKDFKDIAILKSFDGYIHGDDFEIFVTGLESSETNMKSVKSYGTFSNVSHSTADLEANENTTFYNETSNIYGGEDENIDISVDQELHSSAVDEDDCYRTDQSRSSDCSFDNVNEIEENQEYDVDQTDYLAPTSPSVSRKTSVSSHTNNLFIPNMGSMNDLAQSQLQNYYDVIKHLNIDNKIYQGRPKLDYRYYNWCLHEGFTQCSGPVHMDNNLVCCKDLPRNNVTEADASKVWVISAGPKGLVNKVKIWAWENGLKFHEEAFYS